MSVPALRSAALLLLAVATAVLLSSLVWNVPNAKPEPPASHVREDMATQEPPSVPLPALERYEGARDVAYDPAAGQQTAERKVGGRLVVEDGSGVPPGCRVLMLRHGQRAGDSSSPQRIEAPVDVRGEFTLALPDEWRWGEFVQARVVGAFDGIPFDGSVCLAESVYLELAPRHYLHGRVTGRDASPFAGARVTLRHRLRGSGNWANRFVAPDKTDAEGRFRMSKYLSSDLLPEDYIADIALAGNEGFAAVPVRHAALVSVDGAILTLDFARLTVSVRTGETPVAGADVRCSSVAWGQGNGRWLSRTTGEEGRVSFLLPATARAELSVVAGGHAPWFGQVAVDDLAIAGIVFVSLIESSEARKLRGSVLGPDFRPLPDAYLSAWRETELREVGAGSMVHATSDEAGQFELEVHDSLFPCRLVSNHPVHGLSSELRIAEPIQGALEIVHRLRRDVVIHVRSFVAAAPFTSGPMHAFVADRLRGDAGAYALRDPPFTLRGIAEGSYNLALCTAGGHAYGQASFEVRADTPEVVVPIDLGVTMKASGRVVDVNGTPLDGVTVRLLPRNWPGASPPWTACRTSHEGWFEVVPCSLAAEHRIEVATEDRVLWSGSIVQGAANVIAVGID
jgi:hypothetical protein